MLVAADSVPIGGPEPEGVSDEDANDAAVAGQRNALGATSAVEQPCHAGAHPCAHLLVGLAALPAGAAGPAAGIPLGEPLLRLCSREAGPVPHVDLAQSVIRARLEPARLGDDLRGLPGALEIGGVDLGEPLTGQPPGGGSRLASTERRQWLVMVALPSILAIPVRLAVPNEIEQRHAGDPRIPILNAS